MATKVDIESGDGYFKGTDFSIGVTVKNAAGDPIDITGWSLEYTLRRRATDTVALITKTVSDGGIALSGFFRPRYPGEPARAIDATQGQAEVRLEASDTASLRGRVFRHSIVRTDAGSVGSVIPGRGHAGASVTLLELV